MDDKNSNLTDSTSIESGLINSQEELIRRNKQLEQQLEELKNRREKGLDDSSSPRISNNRLSFIADFLSAILASLGSSHSDLTRNFGGGAKGAFFAAVYQSFFLIGIVAVSYGFYQVTNMQEQKVYIPNEEINR